MPCCIQFFFLRDFVTCSCFRSWLPAKAVFWRVQNHWFSKQKTTWSGHEAVLGQTHLWPWHQARRPTMSRISFPQNRQQATSIQEPPWPMWGRRIESGKIGPKFVTKLCGSSSCFVRNFHPFLKAKLAQAFCPFCHPLPLPWFGAMALKDGLVKLKAFAAAPWFPVLVGLLSGANLFVLVMSAPLVILYCSAVLANPKRPLFPMSVAKLEKKLTEKYAKVKANRCFVCFPLCLVFAAAKPLRMAVHRRGQCCGYRAGMLRFDFAGGRARHGLH